jgi:hypothetical protein
MTATAVAGLNWLDSQWGQEYDLAVTAARWVAKRLDNGHALVADSPGKLQTLIASDRGKGRVRCVVSGSGGGTSRGSRWSAGTAVTRTA